MFSDTVPLQDERIKEHRHRRSELGSVVSLSEVMITVLASRTRCSVNVDHYSSRGVHRLHLRMTKKSGWLHGDVDAFHSHEQNWPGLRKSQFGAAPT